MATALSIVMFSYPLLWVAVLAWGLAIAVYVLAAFRKGQVLTPVPLVVTAAQTVVLFGPVIHSTGLLVALPWVGIHTAVLLGGAASIQMLWNPPKH
ncbi:MAG: hypothetical protein JHC81_02025 [Brevundimonas sp.]|uniref:hypothetical protein n=1 Tax=Brevundimonas sp. TaxID=1871086 RepID=UPI001A1FFA39|nr:hypothetical protein [Brevundimonas sp.]MBJ7446285.1 hypothetical protein [Brevundimonas sp.]